MEKRFGFGLILVYFVGLESVVSKPVEVVFTDQPDGYNVIVPDTLVTNAYFIASPIETSHPKCKTQPQSPKVQYIFDYSVQLPCSSLKPSSLASKPSNQAQRPSLRNEPPTTLQKKCICREPTVKASDLIVSCPLHPVQSLAYTPNSIRSRDINLVSTEGHIIKSSRMKREIPKKKIHLKKPIFGKFMKNEKLKHLDTHKVHKREVNQPEKRQIKSFQLKKQYQYPEIIQYFPEVLSANYKPGECFTCCSTKKKGEIVCQPNSKSGQLVGKVAEVSSQYQSGYSSGYSSSLPVVEGYHGLVEVVGQDESETDKAYREYIKAVIHNHEDFIKAEGAQKELVVSEETQRSQAQGFIQKLISDQLARNREDEYYNREFRSAPIAIVPSNTSPADSSFLVKLTQPLHQPGNIPSPVKPTL